jgi:hypothetical protein
MLRVGFEPMIPALERAKTVHAFCSAAAVIGNSELLQFKYTKPRAERGDSSVHVKLWSRAPEEVSFETMVSTITQARRHHGTEERDITVVPPEPFVKLLI